MYRVHTVKVQGSIGLIQGCRVSQIRGYGVIGFLFYDAQVYIKVHVHKAMGLLD